jgi:Fic family protein
VIDSCGAYRNTNYAFDITKKIIYSASMSDIDDIDRKLEVIDTLKKELDGLRPLKTEQAKNLKTLFDVNFTYNSTAIEGNSLSYQETKVVLLDGLTIGGKSVREHLEIINHSEAIDYIEELSHKKITQLYKTDILNIHSIILKSIDPKNSGRYRDIPVYVLLKDGTKHIFCDPLLINDEMDMFFDWLFSNKTIKTIGRPHPLIIAAEAHTRFVSIHPFVDGNGRTARLLLNLILLQNGYVPVIIKNKDRTIYLDAIESWQNNNDSEDCTNKNDFYKLIINYERESLETYLETIKKNILWK